MFSRKGLLAATTSSTRQGLCSGTHHATQSSALSYRINRLFSSSRATNQTQEARRVPQPIPLDIGNGPSVSVLSQSSNGSASAAVSGEGTVAKRRSRLYSNGSFLERFGDPIFYILVYSSAASLLLHTLYNHLSLEEYKIISDKKIKELESEIAVIKAQSSPSSPVQHSLGGRGEFI